MDVKTRKISALMVLAGGLFWIVFGTRLSLSPTGDPSLGIYRDSKGTMPILSIGLMLITTGLIPLYLQFSIRKNITKWAFWLLQIGAVLYFIGHSLRQFLNGVWEPAAPIGFLLVILGLFVFGLQSMRLKYLRTSTSILFMVSALCLLFFNDQFQTSWMSVPFGLIWMIVGGVFWKSSYY